MKSRPARIQLKWRNPYTEPPANQPRVIFDAVLDDKKYRDGTIPEVTELERQYPPGTGYAWHWSLAHIKPRRKWSKKAKGRQRRRNLKKRLQKKIPLFWQDQYRAELAKRPEYYYKGEAPKLVPLYQKGVTDDL